MDVLLMSDEPQMTRLQVCQGASTARTLALISLVSTSPPPRTSCSGRLALRGGDDNPTAMTMKHLNKPMEQDRGSRLSHKVAFVWLRTDTMESLSLSIDSYKPVPPVWRFQHFCLMEMRQTRAATMLEKIKDTIRDLGRH